MISASGGILFGSDGLSVFSFEGADGGLGDPTERGVAATGLAMPLRGLVPLEGSQILGIASNNPPNDPGTSQLTLLDGRISGGTLALDAGAVITGRITSVRASRGVAFFVVGNASGCGRLCKAGLGASTMTCDPGTVCGISLSAGDSLMTTSPATPGSTLVQERSRADFSVTWQVPLPGDSWGVTPLCTNASPLVIAGDPAGTSSSSRLTHAASTPPLSGRLVDTTLPSPSTPRPTSRRGPAPERHARFAPTHGASGVLLTTNQKLPKLIRNAPLTTTR